MQHHVLQAKNMKQRARVQVHTGITSSARWEYVRDNVFLVRKEPAGSRGLSPADNIQESGRRNVSFISCALNSSPKYISCMSMTPINSSLIFHIRVHMQFFYKGNAPQYIKIVASWRYNHQILASILIVWTRGSKVHQRKRAHHNPRTWISMSNAVKTPEIVVR
jgi:hypothetical protein